MVRWIQELQVDESRPSPELQATNKGPYLLIDPLISVVLFNGWTAMSSQAYVVFTG